MFWSYLIPFLAGLFYTVGFDLFGDGIKNNKEGKKFIGKTLVLLSIVTIILSLLWVFDKSYSKRFEQVEQRIEVFEKADTTLTVGTVKVEDVTLEP